MTGQSSIPLVKGGSMPDLKNGLVTNILGSKRFSLISLFTLCLFP